MASFYKSSFKREVINQFTEIGYKVNTMMLNFQDFGVPKSIERLYIFLGNQIVFYTQLIIF